MPAHARPHQSALRFGRHVQDGQVYLITTCTEDREPLFLDWPAGRCVVAEMRRLHDAGRVLSLAWVVMPDHWHWLLQLSDGSASLAQLMNSAKGRSARRINHLLHRRSAVWQRGFHDHALRSDEDLLDVARYVVGNPVRAGLVARIGEYGLWDAAWGIDGV